MTPIPLNIEDEYVRQYLWDRALIAIDDPCCRSHPHEDMNEYCQHKTELARLQNKLAQKPWIGLTNEEKEFIEIMGGKADRMLAEEVEAKLKEKNT